MISLKFKTKIIDDCRSVRRLPKAPPPKKKKIETNESIDANSQMAKKIKEKFRADISGDIVRHLKPYFSETCEMGRIRTNEDFRHLARKVSIEKFTANFISYRLGSIIISVLLIFSLIVYS